MGGEEEEGTEARLRALARRIKALESRLKEENLILDEVLQELRLLRMISSAGASIIRSASYVTGHRYSDIARHIVEALLKTGPLNISQLTEQLRKMRGTASRRIVAEKLGILEDHGLVKRIQGKKREKLYRILKKEGQEDS